jgi:hypothetical protein
LHRERPSDSEADLEWPAAANGDRQRREERDGGGDPLVVVDVVPVPEPRSGFSWSTLTSVQGLRFAVAAWKSGLPGPGTEHDSYRCFASSSETAFANAYRNWS